MSSGYVNAVPEQLCYIACSFCNIVLAVSVPCSRLLEVVTVRCGHCANMWSVNMAAAALRTLSPWQGFQQAPCFASPEPAAANEVNSSSWCNKVTSTPESVNRPSKKRHRAPSAYNQFIREEIQRIKANNPNISHREAFSTAAKNWAHYPRIHSGLILERNNQAMAEEGSDKHPLDKAAACKKLYS